MIKTTLWVFTCKDLDANKRTLFEEKYWFTAGSNQRPLDSKPNAFPTELGGLICRVGFKLLL